MCGAVGAVFRPGRRAQPPSAREQKYAAQGVGLGPQDSGLALHTAATNQGAQHKDR
jgi:hypothetical protein